jgi:hypothetical protein
MRMRVVSLIPLESGDARHYDPVGPRDSFEGCEESNWLENRSVFESFTSFQSEDTLKHSLAIFGLLTTCAIPSMSWAQQSGYSQTNLVSNTTGAANQVDTQLVNPWGISIVAGQALWIADNNSGVSMAYDAHSTGARFGAPRSHGQSSGPNRQ